MRLAQPIFIYMLLIGIPLTLILFWLAFKLKEKAKKRFGNLDLIQKLSSSYSPSKQKLKVFVLVLGLFFLLFSLARPQFGTKLTMLKRKGVDIIIALDTSLSMLAEDMKPNRLEKAKREVKGLIDRMRGDRVGLVAFAGASFVQCPLTLDNSAAKMFLDIIDVNLIPKPGTAIGDAITTSIKAFEQKERKFKVLVLITDGEDHESNPIEAAKIASKEGIRIYTIGIGSVQGEPIPLRDKKGNMIGFKKTRENEVVVSRLDEMTLQKIALETGGKYYHATPNEMELDKIYNEISRMEKKELEGKLLTQYEDRYQYFLIFSLIFLTLEFFISERKGKRIFFKKKGEDVK
ncbi:MAG: VWA domain-containing protein [Candidatus Zixiibacteriota bacterium]